MEIRHGWWCAFAAAAMLALPAHASALGDITPPESTAQPPAAAAGPTFDIPYTASDDLGGSGVARVDLYAKAPGDPAFSPLPVDTDTTPDSPSFTYTPTAGDGQYAFYTVAVDNDGNSELPPLTEDGTTAVDSTPPTSMATAPSTAGSGPITVGYSADDGSGVGVDSVELWAKAPGDSGYSVADTDTTPGTPSFSYTPGGGDGTYSFYTVAVDALGNREQAPSQPDDATLVDSTPPSSAADAPATVRSGAINVTYTADDASGTGVASVELWVKPPANAGYSLAGTDTTPDTPSFTYSPTAGDGIYSFYTVAVDALGNREQAPPQADAQTTRDTTAPSSAASAPGSVGTGSIAVTYTADDGGGTGVATVELWAKAPDAAGYSLAATDSSPASASFNYNPTAGDGTYFFYTVAIDALGNREQAPAQPDAQTTRDTSAPGSTAAAPAIVASGSVPVTYTVTSGDVSSVELWVRAPGDSSFTLNTTDHSPNSPSFTYNPIAGDGTYSFYTVAVDGLGNREQAPAQPDAQTVRDTGPPSSSATAPPTTGSGTITIAYSAGDGQGAGVDSVELWAQAPGDTGFSRAATDTTPDTPSFGYTPAAGDGTYYFYTVAIDRAGNREGVPSTADTHTVRDTSAPPPSSTGQSSSGPVIAQLTAPQPPTAAPSAAAAQQAPSLPLVAALTLVGKQTLRSALRDGLKFRAYVYAPVKLVISATLTRPSAKRLGLLRRPLVASHAYDFAKPAVYELRVRIKKSAAARLRRAKSARFTIKSLLSGSAGSATSRSPLYLRAR